MDLCFDDLLICWWKSGFVATRWVSSWVKCVGTVLNNVGHGTRLTVGTCGYWYGPWILWHLWRCCWLILAPCRLDSRRVGPLWLNVRMQSSDSNLEEKMVSSHWYTSTWSHEKTTNKTSDSIFHSSDKHVFDPIWNSNFSMNLRWLWIWIIDFAIPDQTQNHTAWDGDLISRISFSKINQDHLPYVKQWEMIICCLTDDFHTYSVILIVAIWNFSHTSSRIRMILMMRCHFCFSEVLTWQN